MSIDLISGRGGLGVEIRGVALWSTPRRNQKRAIEKGRQGESESNLSLSTLRDYPNPRLVWGTRNTSSTDSNLRTKTRLNQLRSGRECINLCFLPGVCTCLRDDFSDGSYLVDPASSHMLVSKIKPCMSKYKQIIL